MDPVFSSLTGLSRVINNIAHLRSQNAAPETSYSPHFFSLIIHFKTGIEKALQQRVIPLCPFNNYYSAVLYNTRNGPYLKGCFYKRINRK